MSEADIDGFPGNPVRAIGKSSEDENVQTVPGVLLINFRQVYVYASLLWHSDQSEV